MVRGEIRRSLETKILEEAKLRLPSVLVEMQAILQQARRTLEAELSTTQDDIELIASTWTTKTLQHPELIEERYLFRYPYGLGLKPDSELLDSYLNEREQHSKH